ncbi:DNA gyrase inhibitor YacG [Pseudohalocynthiibacter aestuariivivens]|uniref:DNA gyrase inhibitor YacG n=1 Tax=Roseovarius pelagicus TaxID=2980108 RepID=A0ABY6DAX7_9RHOB|nr:MULTISPECIES: DNA gyrase inhibitor YacG [Rhodobacterales]QIE45045.1 DNA gyrase inhibitor YacG [Pseudohalocynthiibacter aestuariivivens]UXX83019.1 DNA gyrase inhibitor YacG [Roseovarius pelagicus]
MSCPICKAATKPAFRPFCSRRCSDIDLGKWLSGDYAVPSRDPEDIDAAQEAAEAARAVPPKPH